MLECLFDHHNHYGMKAKDLAFLVTFIGAIVIVAAVVIAIGECLTH